MRERERQGEKSRKISSPAVLFVCSLVRVERRFASVDQVNGIKSEKEASATEIESLTQ